MNWNITIIVITILLASFAAWREYQRAGKAHLAWRLVASMVAVIALGCIIYPLTYSTSVSTSSGSGKILLTEGFSADSLGKNDSIFTMDAAVHQQYPKAKLLHTLDDLFADTAHIDPVHVYGYGLGRSALNQLVGRAVIFHASPAPDGFSAASWTEKVRSGQQFKVQGTYKNSSGKPIALVLKGLNATLDSVTIAAKSSTPFTLTSTPKNTGRTVYNLIALSGKDTLQQEQLPVIIERTQPIKVLMLSASPDFETKFLKNWLGSNGYGAASRSVITKGKFGQEYINMDQPDLSHITPALLNKFDLVIGDLSELKNLSAVESDALQQEVTQKGAGLIVRSDSAGKGASWLQGSFQLNHQIGKPSTDAVLNIQGKGKTAKLSVDADFMTGQNNTQSLITDEHGHTLAGLTLDGAGKLVFTTVNHTYGWLLAGDKDDYTKLWSALIDKTLRKSPSAQNWSVIDLPAAGEPVGLVAENNLTGTPVSVGKALAYASQNPVIPFQYRYTYWPQANGWQQVTPSNGSPYWWYTWPKTGWLSLKAAKKTALTREYVQQHPADAAVTKQIHQKVGAAVPKLYFYIIFLIAAAFLWAESKFFS